LTRVPNRGLRIRSTQAPRAFCVLLILRGFPSSPSTPHHSVWNPPRAPHGGYEFDHGDLSRRRVDSRSLGTTQRH
jgi:hypothetical protein